jgi:hypothetical protein
MTVENYSGKDAFKKGEGTPSDYAVGISGGIGGWLSLIDKRLAGVTPMLRRVASSLEDLVVLAKWAGDKDEAPPGVSKGVLVYRLCELRRGWTVADYHDAYGDELEDLPDDIQGCRDICRQYIYNNYDYDYLEEVIENEEMGDNIDRLDRQDFGIERVKDARTKMSAFIHHTHRSQQFHLIAIIQCADSFKWIVFERVDLPDGGKHDIELATKHTEIGAKDWLKDNYMEADYTAYYQRKEDDNG